MEWFDIEEIAATLDEEYPNEDVQNISFTKLKQKVMNLPGFNGLDEDCNERILEAIQQEWLDLI